MCRGEVLFQVPDSDNAGRCVGWSCSGLTLVKELAGLMEKATTVRVRELRTLWVKRQPTKCTWVPSTTQAGRPGYD